VQAFASRGVRLSPAAPSGAQGSGAGGSAVFAMATG
jgi:hypothetical protein